MNGDAYSYYCKKNSWERCAAADLIVVKVLVENHDSDGELTEQVAIYRCRACGGFFKRKYSATYYDAYQFDTEEGWSVTDKYFKTEAPLWSGLHSSGEIPLTLEEARAYGFAGEDLTWKNGRCNFDLQNVELTCRARDLQMVAYLSSESNRHNSEKLYKCRRCGEWYFFKVLPPYTEALLKSSNELFPLEAARRFGYAANVEMHLSQTVTPPKVDISMIKGHEFLDESLAAAWTTPEKLPDMHDWLKEKRSDAAHSQYVYIIMKKHFARCGVPLKADEIPRYWWGFGIDLYGNIHQFVSRREHSEMLRAMFTEVVDFCEAFSGEFFASNLLEFLEGFIDRDPPRSLVVPLLPEKARARFGEMFDILAARHEADMERQNQMGY